MSASFDSRCMCYRASCRSFPSGYVWAGVLSFIVRCFSTSSTRWCALACMACAVRLCTCFGSICAAGGLPWGLAGGAGVHFYFRWSTLTFHNFTQLEAFLNRWRAELAPTHSFVFTARNGAPLTMQGVHRIFTSTSYRLASPRKPSLIRQVPHSQRM